MFLCLKKIDFLLSKALNVFSGLIFKFKKYGFLGSLNRLIIILTKNKRNTAYQYILPTYNSNIIESLTIKKKPMISVLIPFYASDAAAFKRSVNSLINQWYSNWELFVITDSKSSDIVRETTEGVAQNVTVEDCGNTFSNITNNIISHLNEGYFIYLENGDELTIDALYEIVILTNSKNVDLIYSDEDVFSVPENYISPIYKPDISSNLILSFHYISNLCAIKNLLLQQVGGFRDEYGTAKNYDLALRILDVAKDVCHIPKVLYHSKNYCLKQDKNYYHNAKLAVASTIKRRRINANVLNGAYPPLIRVKYCITNKPLITIIIPFKDKPDFLLKCLNSIIEKSTYENFEIIGISNNSCEEDTFNTMCHFEKIESRVRFYEYNEQYNYSKINNFAVNNYANGEHIIFLNNDTEVINHDWIETMLEHSQRKDVGAVGGKLYYSNGKIQHAGVVIGKIGIAGHIHRYEENNSSGYLNCLQTVKEVSALTCACLMLKKDLFKLVNGFDEKIKVNFNDVDLCLKIIQKGFVNIFTPYTEILHHEKISRGRDDNFLKDELYYLKTKWGVLLDKDPYFSSNIPFNNEGDMNTYLDQFAQQR